MSENWKIMSEMRYLDKCPYQIIIIIIIIITLDLALGHTGTSNGRKRAKGSGRKSSYLAAFSIYFKVPWKSSIGWPKKKTTEDFPLQHKS